MKKTIILLFALSLIFTGCTKKEELSLNGTVWKGTEKTEQQGGWTYIYTYTLIFQKSTFTYIDNSYCVNDTSANWSMTTEGTYVYEHPKVTLIMSDPDYGETIITATITGNTMLILWGESFGDQNYLTLTKQQ